MQKQKSSSLNYKMRKTTGIEMNSQRKNAMWRAKQKSKKQQIEKIIPLQMTCWDLLHKIIKIRDKLNSNGSIYLIYN